MIQAVNYRTLLKGFLLGLAVVIILFCASFFDNRTKIVFCDVGQGDGAYIRIKNRFDLVIDAGPDRNILNCLGRYIPFYDRTIDLAILSHNQKDHFGGYEYIIDRYSIKRLFITSIQNPNKSFVKLKEKLIKKNVRIDILSKGREIEVLGDSLIFFWPDNPCVSSNDNDCSLVFSFKEKLFNAVFTGDSSPLVLNRLSDKSIKNVSVLKIPHHGSKNGLTKKFLRLANPEVTVISVGKKNSYGHPNKEVLDMLESSGTIIKRTDLNGDIMFKLPN